MNIQLTSSELASAISTYLEERDVTVVINEIYVEHQHKGDDGKWITGQASIDELAEITLHIEEA
jgi:hypothetical protein|tara:strand:- start:520 stop:711 length:192 start_codon:yes stop_codon:yes gene_type:complete